ncbi:L,D-transpeptidase family protein [Streptomyces sp. NPDC089919]|uniref:L,D-transpeptidase family protein n=1 Tax=Streptomyces sp. NPDC089919 TaxID=3155188 RepID=UPI003445400C
MHRTGPRHGGPGPAGAAALAVVALAALAAAPAALAADGPGDISPAPAATAARPPDGSTPDTAPPPTATTPATGTTPPTAGTAPPTGTTPPSATAAPPAGTAPPVADACTADTGPYQRELEAYLGRPVDGRQSEADCRAVRAFQEAQGLDPADGYPDLATYRTTLVVEERRHPNRDGRCPAEAGRVVCVDLTRQLMWVQRGGKPVYQAVPVRSGREGQETRTGRHEIDERVIDEHSELYDDAPMPYAQYFDGGQALHGVYGDLFEGPGSAGCVNLHYEDAERLWNTTRTGDPVVVWGRKPATGPN